MTDRPTEQLIGYRVAQHAAKTKVSLLTLLVNNKVSVKRSTRWQSYTFGIFAYGLKNLSSFSCFCFRGIIGHGFKLIKSHEFACLFPN